MPPSPFPTNKTQACFPRHHAKNRQEPPSQQTQVLPKSTKNPRHYGEQREESGEQREESGERRAQRGKEKEEREKIGQNEKKGKKKKLKYAGRK